MVHGAPAWRVVDFISDLHLQASRPATMLAWQRYMAHTQADAVFILGDLFEVWVGDDVTQFPDTDDGRFALQCQYTLQAASKRLGVYFMHGNRDFLLGAGFAKLAGMTVLADPCVLQFDGHRLLLSHGDALCLGDVDYQQFRKQVRSATWQAAFLAKPLTHRQAVAKHLREQSEALKSDGASYADADEDLTRQWLHTQHAHTLIHGHTHQPANHLLVTREGTTLQRWVLSDWDANATPARAQVLRLSVGLPPARLPIL